MIALRYPTLYDVVYTFQHLAETSRNEIAAAQLSVEAAHNMVKYYVARGTATAILLGNRPLALGGSYAEGANLRKTWFFMSLDAEANGRMMVLGARKWAEREAYLFPNDRFEAVTYLPDSVRRDRFFRLLGMRKAVEGRGFTVFERLKMRVDNGLQVR